MWSITNLLTFVLVALAAGTPIGPSDPFLNATADRHLTTGIATRVNGRPYIRREIRELRTNYPDQWNLYLLGLQAFQQMNQDDPLSYYRVAGIHGRPFGVWQDAQGVPAPGVGGGQAYCPHGNIMFLPWHRPYLALFEVDDDEGDCERVLTRMQQEIYEQIRAIADQPSLERERWIAAADAFRVPYWDWALGEKGGPVPDIFTVPVIQVTGPDAIMRTIENPLYQFNFHPVDVSAFSSYFVNWNSTLRYPTTNESSATSQNQKFINNFLSSQRSYLDDVAQGFSSTQTFNDFANKIQDVHGWVHGVIGSSSEPTGHMWQLEYSAFEPLFMLHHANVDRLFAIYQALHPDRWMTPENVALSGNFWIPNNVVVDATWPMQPFWKDSQTFWTGDDIRDLTVFGYTYSEIQPWNYVSDDDFRAALNAYVVRTYSPSARTMLTNSSSEGNSNLADELSDDGTFIDWTITMNVPALKMPPTFRVVFSLASDSSSNASTKVGVWTKLMPKSHDDGAWKARRAEKKAKRDTSTGQLLSNTISLTSSLLDQVAVGRLPSLGIDVVVPYLKGQLTWDVFGIDGARIDSDDTLQVNVLSTTARIPADATQPLEYIGDPISHPEAVNGKHCNNNA